MLIEERHLLSADSFVEIVVWHRPRPARGSAHRFKYRLALVVEGTCVLHYDNEAGKGGHRHWRGLQELYEFTDPNKLLEDFWRAVAEWRR